LNREREEEERVRWEKREGFKGEIQNRKGQKGG